MNSRANKRVRLFESADQNRSQEEEKDENQGDDARSTPVYSLEQAFLLQRLWGEEAVAAAEAARKEEERAQPQDRVRLDYEQKGAPRERGDGGLQCAMQSTNWRNARFLSGSQESSTECVGKW